MTFVAWDIETETDKVPYLKRKASPFHPDNLYHAVLHAWRPHKGEMQHVWFGKAQPTSGWLRPVLKDCKVLVGQNIKFDLLHALQDEDNLEAWMDYIANGGAIWDIQLAEYMLEGMGQPVQMLTLDEMAPKYGGSLKVDEVKLLWAAGVQTSDIDPELLERYLLGGKDERGDAQLGDVDNTLKIAIAQIRRAHEVGQLNSLKLNMGALVCSVEYERNGMFVDKPYGIVLAGELASLIAVLKEELNKYLPQDLPFTFSWTSRHHKSALLFGGTVYFDSREYTHADGTSTLCSEWNPAEYPPLEYVSKDVEVVPYNVEALTAFQLETCKQLEVTPGYVLHDDAKKFGIPVVRFSSGKRQGEPKTKIIKVPDHERPKSRKCKAPYTFPRMTDPKRAWATDEPGVYSVSEGVVEELAARGIPFVKALHKLQGATKDLGTYFITTDSEGKQKGMLTLVGLDGIIHHSINHTNTVTGRLSSSDPNLQNLPKGNKSKLKLIFVSRFRRPVTDDFGNVVFVSEGKIIQSDFSALEIYIQALLTQCTQLIADLKAGLDMHCLRLASKEGMPYDEVYALCKGDKYSEEWDYKRTGAKMYSFAAAYGAGDAKIASDNDMPIEEVAALRAADDARYPGVNEFYKAVTNAILASRKPMGKVIPHPDIPGVTCNLGRGTYRTPDGKLYEYIESPSPEYLAKRGKTASFSPTEIKNYITQGTGGEWMKAAMWIAVRMFYKYRNFGGLALLVNTVHDAQYVDAHESVALQAAALLHACMEGANDYMEMTFCWKVDAPVPSDTSWGANMKEELKIPGLKELAMEYRKELRDKYLGGYVPSFAQENLNG